MRLPAKVNAAAPAMLAFGAMLALCAGCTTMTGTGAEAPADAGSATAMLATVNGTPQGRATASAIPGGLRIEVSGMALAQGPHGIHIHMTGRCDGPDFMTAGGHWNPTGAQHGSLNPAGPHAGDLPNLLIGTDGRGAIGFDLPGARMTGEGGLLDADGAAFVVHAGIDDLRSDPAGNSGARIVCGVFVAG